MARITLYVPDELKARMDAAGDSINWSEVARPGIEAALSNAGSHDSSGRRLPQALMDLGRSFIIVDGKRHDVQPLLEDLVRAVRV